MGGWSFSVWDRVFVSVEFAEAVVPRATQGQEQIKTSGLWIRVFLDF